ncbi:MAG: hypothetical protein HC859_12475 [Bacteroidia bacterium]|nr:hypothetical protein [Bacteroidia bacterium]
MRQKLFKFLGLKIGVQNLLNQPVRLFMDLDRDEVYTPEPKYVSDIQEVARKDVMRMKYYEGMYITAGLSLIL